MVTLASHCDWRYLPPDCDQPLYAHDAAIWDLLRGGMAVVHGGVFLLSCVGVAFQVYQLTVGMEPARATAAKLLTSPKEVAFLLNMVAALLRALTAVDPLSTLGVYDQTVSQVGATSVHVSPSSL